MSHDSSTVSFNLLLRYLDGGTPRAVVLDHDLRLELVLFDAPEDHHRHQRAPSPSSLRPWPSRRVHRACGELPLFRASVLVFSVQRSVVSLKPESCPPWTNPCLELVPHAHGPPCACSFALPVRPQRSSPRPYVDTGGLLLPKMPSGFDTGGPERRSASYTACHSFGKLEQY